MSWQERELTVYSLEESSNGIVLIIKIGIDTEKESFTLLMKNTINLKD